MTFQFKDWRCISQGECRNMSITVPGESISDVVPFKSYEGQCLETCPPNTEEYVMEDKVTHTCRKCDNCPRKCRGKHITSLNVLTTFEGCTHVKGHVTIQMKGCKFSNVFLFLAFAF